MGNAQNRLVTGTLPHSHLDELIRVRIQRRCRFIKDQNATAPQHNSRKRQQLALTNRQIRPTGLHRIGQRDCLIQMRVAESLENLGLGILPERIQITPHSPREKVRFLRHDRQRSAESLKAHLRDVQAIDCYAAA